MTLIHGKTSHELAHGRDQLGNKEFSFINVCGIQKTFTQEAIR
jgi:hypothetical protein